MMLTHAAGVSVSREGPRLLRPLERSSRAFLTGVEANCQTGSHRSPPNAMRGGDWYLNTLLLKLKRSAGAG